jgi:hypothetical protein
MERCAYCGEKVGDDGLYVDDEVFCSEDCMRDFGASDDGEEFDDDDDDDVESGQEDTSSTYGDGEDDY